jgi:hypothetical protein
LEVIDTNMNVRLRIVSRRGGGLSVHFASPVAECCGVPAVSLDPTNQIIPIPSTKGSGWCAASTAEQLADQLMLAQQTGRDYQ